jgi:hypothetical protein
MCANNEKILMNIENKVEEEEEIAIEKINVELE